MIPGAIDKSSARDVRKKVNRDLLILFASIAICIRSRAQIILRRFTLLQRLCQMANRFKALIYWLKLPGKNEPIEQLDVGGQAEMS